MIAHDRCPLPGSLCAAIAYRLKYVHEYVIEHCRLTSLERRYSTAIYMADAKSEYILF